MRRCLAAALLSATLAGPALAQGQPPLRCGVDGTFAPHAFPSLQGGVQGFQIDLFREVAKRMGREIVIESASFSGLIPAMNAGRYDFLCAPTTVTRERAEALLFTEGYIWTELQKMEESYFNKFDARLSAIERTNEDLKAVNVQLSAENEELKRQLAETPAEHTKFNPDAEVKRDFQFKIGAKRNETIQDRVFNSLF